MSNNHPKKCPKCNSTRIIIHGHTFHCKKCGFLNQPLYHLKQIQNEK